MYRIIKLVLIGLSVVAAVLWVTLLMSDNPEESGSIQSMFYIMYAFVAVASVAALFYGLTKMLATPGGLKKAIFSLGGLAVLAIAGYAMASGEQPVVDEMAKRDIVVTTGTVKAIGTLLNVFFGMVLVAVLLMVVPGFKRVLGR